MMNLVALLRRIELDTTDPEVGDFADDGPAVVAQPDPIPARQVVLPLGDGDIRVDVNLSKHAGGEVRSMVNTRFRIGFPRIHNAARAVLAGSLPGRLHGPVAKHHYRQRALRMQQQQCRKYPGIAVPERMTCVVGSEGTGSHRPSRPDS